MPKAQASAIVTGGSSGLGAATAKLLAAEGFAVVIADVQDGSMVAKEIAGEYVKCDVTKTQDINAALKAATAKAPLRCVVNCAGILAGARIVGKEGAHDLATFEKVIQVNLIGTFNMLRLAAEKMSQQDATDADEARGVIINTASIAAFEGQIGQAAYSASKAGVAGLTLPAAREFARFGIRVVTIAPGLFETPMMKNMPEKVLEALNNATEYPKRLGTAEEYAKLVLSIVNNPLLNGCTIRLDGAVRLTA
jgi:NAD(P)-dependent dehydrogenase (short-subunit alcohol dehydrogenase family)